jgi:hypothetical protein
MNNSNIYQSMIKFRQDLNKQMSLVDDYLSKGTATTTISYYDLNHNYLGHKEETSNWTTSIGKQRVQTKHQWLIRHYSKHEMPSNTQQVVITSPFAETGESTIEATIKVQRQINVVCNGF